MQKKITNVGSGTYFNEIDLTVVQQSAGTFAGAAIGLTEKGPAFEAMGFASFEDRALRMGDLNPAFKTSYYAREFLAQASNYKEVRILGLEGYNEDPDIQENGLNFGGLGKSFVIMYDDGLEKATAASSVLRISDITLNGTDVTVTVSGTPTLVDGQTVNIQNVKGITQTVNSTQIALEGRYFVDNFTPGQSSVSFVLQEYIEGTGLANIKGAGTYTTGTGTISASTPVKARSEMIAAVLKPRRSTDLAYPIIDYVVVGKATQIDGTSEATDEIFTITIYYKGNQSTYPPLGAIKCSLREGSANYIVNVFGNDPKNNTKVLGVNSPLWVEYIYPSVKAKCDITGTLGYYYPGGRVNLGAVEANHIDFDIQSSTPGVLPTPLSVLNLVEGNITVTKSFSYEEIAVDNVEVNDSIVTVTTSISHGFTEGSTVTLSNIAFVSGESTLYLIDGNWVVKNVASTSFDIVDINGNNPSNIIGTYSRKADSFVKKAFIPTWESEIMDLGGKGAEVQFQTPVTPWIVSDFDDNGIVKRLFRVWSISDGESANTEIKIEISNVNPDGNNGSGSFDLKVRNFNDKEDTGVQIYEAFSNLTLDSKSTNYILRRIGDGDQFNLQSSFIYIELNEDDIIPKGALPYGCEGYPNTYGVSTPDLTYTIQYNLANSISKQILGLANNNINMRKEVTLDNFSFKNISSHTSIGKGFHLNPRYFTANNSTVGTGGNFDPAVYQIVEKDYFLTDHRSYNTSTTNTTKVTGLQKVARCKFVVSLFGGFDAWNVYKDRTWDDITSKDREALDKAIAVLADQENLYTDFSVLTTPDINFEYYPSATSAILEMVEKRGDALYLIDFDYGYISKTKPEINAINAKITLDSSLLKSSFTACYYPDTQLSDSTNNINVWLPPSVIALATIASVATKENVWQPPAGTLRTVTENLVRTRKRMKGEDREILKSANINPITEFPGSGYEITESRTTQPVFSALSFIHNRLLLGYAKKALNQVLRPLLHQLKDDNLRDAFLNAVRPIFARIKRLNGLAEFDVIVTGLSEDRTTLHGRIIITPLYPVERIMVDFVLKDGAIDYNAQ